MASSGKTTDQRPGKESSFSWEGKDKAGKTVRGTMCAASEVSIKVCLRRQGIVPSKIKKAPQLRRHAISDKEIALLTRQLATMMKAGVPLLQSFHIVGKSSANPVVATLMQDLRADIETGTSLHHAFRKYPLYFDTLFCNLVGAGEQAGILEEVLNRLAVFKEKTHALKARITSAMMYPLAIVAVALIVSAVIMIWVVPAFKDVFASFGAELPALTLLVMALSEWLVRCWPYLLGALVSAIWGFSYAWRRWAKLQRWGDIAMLKVPICGDLLRKASIARWSRTLATMFAAGVPLIESLDSVAGSAGNILFLDATKGIQKAISTGTSLTLAMQSAKIFPELVTQMVLIGEESGALDSMLGKVAEYYEDEVEQAVNALATLVEPLIMVILGLLIGTLLIAMYLPIFKLGSVM